MLHPYIKKQYESLHREIQGLKRGDPTLLISNAVPDVLLLDNFTCTIFLGGQRLIQKTYKGIVMDANVRASDYRSTIISFRSSSFTFTVGNIASLVIIVFGDLTSQAQLALAAFVVINNLAAALSFDNAIGGFSVLAKDLQNENSNYGKEAGKAPFGFYRIFCLVICIVAAVTQLLAIYA